MVSLDPNYVQVDAPRFEALIEQADEESLTKAMDLYKGEFLAGMSTDAPDFEEWLDQSRSRFRDLALHGLVHLIEQHNTAGNLDLAIKSAHQALRIDPYREDIHRHLMRMFAARGMRAAAMAQFRECESILWRELGVAPDGETISLNNEIMDRGELSGVARPNETNLFSTAAAVKRDDGPLLVGFDQELAVLEKHLREAIRSGARLVLMTGEAGSGKTALLSKFRRDLISESVSTVTARAHPAEQSLAFGFWKDILNAQELQTRGSNDLSSLLVRRLAFFKGDDGAAAKLYAGIAHLPWQAFEALVELLRVRCENRAFVVIVEDLHFADEASLQLLSYAVRNLRQSPVLFIATTRPELLSKRRDLAAIVREIDREKLSHNVAVPSLGRVQMETLVRRLRKMNHVAMVSRVRLREIWSLSDGIPAIVVEAAMSGCESSPGAPEDVPNVLRTDLELRLEGLDETAKLLAATASVIGESIAPAVLARAAGVDEETALNGVEALLNAGVLASRNEALDFACGRYRLAQYRMLLPARRRQLHRAVAEAVAEEPIVNPVVHFAALAHHNDAAGRDMDALRNGMRLAQVQMRQGTYAMAKQSFRRVLQVIPPRPSGMTEIRCGADARVALVEIEEIAGQFDQTLSLLSDPTERNEELLGAALRSRYFALLGRLNSVRGNDEAGRDYFRRAVGKSREDEYHLWLPSDRVLEFIHILGGRFPANIDRLTNARETAHRRGLTVDETVESVMICLLQAANGVADQAIDDAQMAIDRATRLGDSRLLAAAVQAKGIAYTWCGDISGALPAFDKAIKLAASSGDLPRLYSVHGFRGQALVAAGRYAEAGADLDKALIMGEDLNLGFSRPLFLAWKAEALAETGDRSSALPEARTALKVTTAANKPWAYSVALRALACALAHPDVRDLAGAERAIRMALSEQSALGLAFERARSLVAYARILHTAGETKKSAGLIRQARNLLRQMRTAVNREAAQSL
ncbi:MAG TPA: BTAD domain-containing putative transcriptional regulator, partial [Hyphomicrobiales bacterium]|nr:BTAD domain-containing putative transcriptional regulator [Hyphomicrobiales bacterium]